MLAACQVPPTLFRGVISRLEGFAQPFIATPPGPQSRTHGRTPIAGPLPDAERKNAESIAYGHDLDRRVIRRFIGEVAWDHVPLLAELNRRVAAALGRPEAVLVFDPSAFPQPGAASGRGRGAAGSARSASTSATSVTPPTPRSTPGSTCPARGPRTASAARRPAGPRRSSTERGASRPWRGSGAAARRGRGR